MISVEHYWAPTESEMDDEGHERRDIRYLENKRNIRSLEGEHEWTHTVWGETGIWQM